MTTWRKDIEDALAAFCDERGLDRRTFRVEYLPAPHIPLQLPSGNRGVYNFWYQRLGWLKIGIVGEKSGPRWTTQHYLDGNADSSLPGSIRLDPEMGAIAKLDRYALREWIMRNTCRANILMPAEVGRAIQERLEQFLHRRLNPRYEGGRRGRRLFDLGPLIGQVKVQSESTTSTQSDAAE